MSGFVNKFVSINLIVALNTVLGVAYSAVEDRVDFEVNPTSLLSGEYQIATKLLTGDQMLGKGLPILDAEDELDPDAVYVATKYAAISPRSIATFSFENLVDTDFIQSFQAVGELSDTDVVHIKRMVIDLALGPISLSSEENQVFIDGFNFATNESLVSLDYDAAMEVANLDENLGTASMLAYSNLIPLGESNTLEKAVVTNAYYEMDEGTTLVVGYFVAKIGVKINKTVLKFSKGIVERALRAPFTSTIKAYQSE